MLQIEWRQNQREGSADRFRIIFLAVALGTLFCAIAASALAVLLPAMTANVQKVFDALLSSFTLGVGAILGLLGGDLLGRGPRWR